MNTAITGSHHLHDGFSFEEKMLVSEVLKLLIDGVEKFNGWLAYDVLSEGKKHNLSYFPFICISILLQML